MEADGVDPNLTRSDLLVLHSLLQDIDQSTKPVPRDATKKKPKSLEAKLLKHDAKNGDGSIDLDSVDQASIIKKLDSMNDPKQPDFEPTIFVSWDLTAIRVPDFVQQYFLQPYVKWGRTVVRAETDVVMLTHLILYFTTSVPSAIYLFYSFSWLHGILHLFMQLYYVGTYTLMMHQHIHMRGILNKKYAWFDHTFPYITDPLMGHTWNSYFYHHVKHHHIEGNGPDDLSSTLRYQRDNIWHFAHYLTRFGFLIWFDLPMYFIRKNKRINAAKAFGFEMATLTTIFCLAKFVNFKAAIFSLIAPLMLMRIGLMVGNWGQHAFVDEVEPNSDFRSSITLIDVASNRFCFNDGYHTSHHLNPMRHWREHPVAFLKQKDRYAHERALVFRNIDYIMITVKLMQRDYQYLAERLVPIGDQIGMSIDEIATMLRLKTRRFTEEDIRKKFNTQ